MRTAIAIEHYGSQAELARALGITRSAVSQWGKIIPEGTAYKIQSITKGKLKVDAAFYTLKKAAREIEART